MSVAKMNLRSRNVDGRWDTECSTPVEIKICIERLNKELMRNFISH